MMVVAGDINWIALQPDGKILVAGNVAGVEEPATTPRIACREFLKGT